MVVEAVARHKVLPGQARRTSEERCTVESEVAHKALAAVPVPVDTDMHQDRLAGGTVDIADIVDIAGCRGMDTNMPDTRRMVQDNPDKLDYCACSSYASFHDYVLHCCCCHCHCRYRCHCPPGQIRTVAGRRAIKNTCSSFTELTNGTDFMRVD